MNVLVLNCGSSSIKYQLVDMAKDAEVLAKGLVERIGLEMGEFTHKPTGKEKYYIKTPIPTHKVGIDFILNALVDQKIGVIKSLKEINACGHRVAHGGEVFKKSVIVGIEEKAKIKELCSLAPLHNPANLEGIEAMEALLPGVPQIAVFDTSYHQTMPAEAYMYAIDYKYYTEDKIRRYGFHGTSHKFVSEKAAKLANLDIKNSKIVSCHLGNGASICAVKNGESIDTSMGFTPVEGLVMGTRAGDLDIGAFLFICEKEGLNMTAANNLINKKSGLLGLSGHADMREVCDGKNNGNERDTIAFNLFCNRVRKYIGGYAATMGGIDLILFTGGIGENADDVREKICEGLEFLGVEFDKNANDGKRGVDLIISKPSSKVKVMMISTNEEYVIASETFNLVK
ncbi:MAG: acetate kinase [Bacteroidales bacterium]|jgi:acetate kinase|nr:acetate kinase [Bacteroidales bacterium]MDD4001940.1 acetate kinase [Bacteroidales bacterium]MDD4829833.1 acetate kinase [Bacteroidales bacterium]